ncbi:MAG TPA: PAS domain S-box protein [Rhizomicrobium sp.]|nr:PAS domain S-box protein [Rhizomicrobium sp.]
MDNTRDIRSGLGGSPADAPGRPGGGRKDEPNGARAKLPGAVERRELARQAEVLAVLFNLTDRLHRAESRDAIYDATMDAMFEGLACDRAAILLFANDGPMRFVAWRDLSDPYRSAVEGHSPWRRNDIAARPIFIPDLDRSDLDAGLNDAVRHEGIRALGFFPVIAESRVIGKFMAYYDAPRSFGDDAVELGLTIARQLAFALSRIAAQEARSRVEQALFEIADAERRRLTELEALMESAPVAIWVTRDPECRIVTGNPAAHALFHVPPGANLSLLGQNGERPATYRLFRGGSELREGPVWRAAHGEIVRDFEMEVRYTDGAAPRHIVGNAMPLVGADNKIFGAVAAFVDITERKKLGNVQEHLASIVEFSDDAIISKDTSGVILSWNKGAERLFGYKAEEIVGRNITTIIPHHLLHEEPTILARIKSGERIDHYETQRRRKNGTLVDISLTVSPMRNQKGEIVAASKIARDITEKKKAEAQHNLLVAELNHRVKNTLATVVSIARQSFSGPEMREARGAFNARIRGLAQSHARLAEADWTSVELQALFEDEFAPYRQGGNVRLSGPPVALSPKAALTLGLAIHELATNAAKYGALSADGGRVDVRWSIDATDDALSISWVESGGPPVVPPTRHGFGRLLLERALGADLKSTITLAFAPEGVRFTAVIPALQYRAQIP